MNIDVPPDELRRAQSRAGREIPPPKHVATGGWQIGCEAKRLRGKPLRVILRERPVVLFRDEHGVPTALEDRCAHRNAPLSLGRVHAGRLQCAYHGWEYDARGCAVRVPALPASACPGGVRVARYACIEQDGFVWIALGEGEPPAEPPRFPHLGERGWTSFTMTTRFRASAEACLENFLDCPHATFVHNRWFRSPTAKTVRAVVRTLDDGAIVEFFAEPREKSVVWSLLAPRGGAMMHTDRYIAPATSRVDYVFPNGWHYIITSSCTEVSATETEVYTVISFKAGLLAPLVRLYFEPLAHLIIRQDVCILEAQQANVEAFGAPRFASTKADLLGGYITAWRRALSAGVPPPPAGTVREVEIRL